MQAATKSGPVAGSGLQKIQQQRKWRLRLALILAVAALFATSSSWKQAAHPLYDWLEDFGLYLILICILGRTWCTLYIGGHKKKEIISAGPYSIVRNPLYVFTIIGAAGAGAQSGSMVLMLVFAVASIVIFYSVVLQEEAFLANAFPHQFAEYVRSVPRFLPNVFRWRDATEIVVQPNLVNRTFLDASLFALAVPAGDLIDWLHATGLVPVAFFIP